MADIKLALKRFIDSEIALSKSDIDSAAKSREWLVTKIVDRIKEKGEIVLHNAGPYIYFGSYFKGTKVGNADEFDVLLVIDSNTGIYSVGGVEVGTGLGAASPNPKYSPDFFFEDGSKISPAKMLNWLKRTIAEVTKEYGGEVPERAGEAVTALIKSKGIKIDFVPAGVFSYKADPKKFFFNIPSGNKSANWKSTNPLEDMERMKYYSENRNDFKNVIRLIKYIKDKDQYNMAIPSYAVESTLIRYVESNNWEQNLYIDFMNALLFMYQQMKANSLKDPFDESINLFSSIENIEWYADRLLEIRSKIISSKEILDQEDAYKIISSSLKNK
jgi:hypothetical protein